MMHKKYQNLATCFIAHQNCVKLNNEEWRDKWEDKINYIISSLPHGSGIDGKTELDFEKSTNNKLIINSEFHYMDENGFYDGWINFKITLKPAWDGCDINITGNFLKKHYGIKDYLCEIFGYDLEQEQEISI